MICFIRVLLCVLHGLLFVANILAGIHISDLYPVVDPSKEMGAGGVFGFLTCLGTFISFLITWAIYDGYRDKDVVSGMAALHAAVIAGIVSGWVYWVA